MPGIDPNVSCHQLTLDSGVSVVAQRCIKQSPEKSEAVEKAVKDLLEANFIFKAKYTTWLSNVVLVKKSNGKWRMCVDYIDLNMACEGEKNTRRGGLNCVLKNFFRSLR